MQLERVQDAISMAVNKRKEHDVIDQKVTKKISKIRKISTEIMSMLETVEQDLSIQSRLNRAFV